MATDKLINMDQGDDIIDALSDIATNINTITYGPQTSADKVVSMTGYQKSSATDPGAISQGDTLNEAVGKLEKRVDNTATAIADKIESYTDATTSGHVVTFNNSTGTQVTDSGVSIATSTTGVTDVDTTIPTSKSVVAYAATKDHTHNYAGSSSAGGAATSADKLNIGSSNIGSATQPVYFDKTTGKPVAITNTIQSNVPANAVFTDTTYTVAEGTANGKIKVTPSSGTAYEVPVHGLGNAAYKGVATSVSTSEDLVTSKAVNTKLASYVPNSDFVVAVDNGVKNLLHFDDSNTVIGNYGGFTINGLNAITVYGKAAWAKSVTRVSLSPGTYKLMFTIDSTDVNMGIDIHNEPINTNYYTEAFTTTGTYTREFTIPTGVSPDEITCRVCCNNSTTTQTNLVTTKVSNVMICTKSLFDISPMYEPYAIGNQYLTPELIELCDSGAKNLLDLSKCTFTGLSNSYTVSGNTITIISYTTSSGIAELSLTTSQLPTNTNIVLTGCPSGGGDTTYLVDAYDNGTYINGSTDTGSGSSVFKFTTTTQKIRIRLAANYTITNKSFNLMVCTKAAFGVSSKFVPYRPNWDLVCSNVETVIKGLKTVSAEYALIPGLTVDIPPYAYVEYKCGMLWDGTGPRGVIVSLLNTDPYYAQAGSVVGKAECTESQLVLTVSGEYINNSNTTKTFYVWAKGAGSASNYMWLAYKFVK